MRYETRKNRQRKREIQKEILQDKNPPVTITGYMLWQICLHGIKNGVSISDFARYCRLSRDTVYRSFNNYHHKIKPLMYEAVHQLYTLEEINQGIEKYYVKFPNKRASELQASNEVAK